MSSNVISIAATLANGQVEAFAVGSDAFALLITPKKVTRMGVPETLQKRAEKLVKVITGKAKIHAAGKPFKSVKVVVNGTDLDVTFSREDGTSKTVKVNDGEKSCPSELIALIDALLAKETVFGGKRTSAEELFATITAFNPTSVKFIDRELCITYKIDDSEQTDTLSYEFNGMFACKSDMIALAKARGWKEDNGTFYC